MFAILSKADALYSQGLFEKSMIQHFRGIKIRPGFQNDIFTKGIRLKFIINPNSEEIDFASNNFIQLFLKK